MYKIGKSELGWAFRMALCIMVLASLPYIFGYGIVSPGYKFVGFTYNIDDACVYMSWMRQAADGHFFLRNLFTTEHQTGNGFNLLFFFLGTFTRITSLPLVAVFHLSRIVSGVALLMAIYAVSGLWLKDVRSRRIALLVAGLSAGIGWILPADLHQNMSVDTWQPETITFLSVYLSPLLSFPTLLMVGAIHFLCNFTETRKWKDAAFAGLILMLLANVHTYDIITFAIVWALYALYRLVLRPRNVSPVVGGLVAALIALPLAGYQLYFYYTEPVFRMRAAVPTLTPTMKWYLMGYGLLIPLAVVGMWKSLRDRRNIELLLCWIAGGFIAIYLPVSFQRKLIMGTHIPLSILATIGLIALTDRLRPRIGVTFIVLAIAFMAISNVEFIMRDADSVMRNESQTIAHVPLLSDNELAAMDYLRANTASNDIILATPGTSILIPGYCGRMVYCGHWGETVSFVDKLSELVRFYMREGTDHQRRAFLRKRGITYVLGYHNLGNMKIDIEDFRESPVPYLRPVFDTEEVSVYQVARDSL